ncbi:hypothetical protein KB1_24600 [Cutibacterium modestum]|uniref:Uncharacterized protein n=1 Tax=Cutibacterium modestum TaxID=2559073 RepID=A0AAD1KQQ7_9ACTN|nr:hypothetical protein KB1_24600 [Cutibacterium modestum]
MKDAEQHDATDAVPEGWIRAYVLEVLQANKFLHCPASTEKAAILGNLLVKASSDALDDGSNEYDAESDGEWQRE